jgi:hypothetical protein
MLDLLVLNVKQISMFVKTSNVFTESARIELMVIPVTAIMDLLVLNDFTFRASKSNMAVTGIIVYSTHTVSVNTWITLTFVDVSAAVHATISWVT